ncbi:hypothetical protein [Nocardioides sp. CF8]|nr:hypothetical protein [Nocardioides sp. CF8]
MWQDDQSRSAMANDVHRLCAGQAHNANDDHQLPLIVPRFPWYY